MKPGGGKTFPSFVTEIFSIKPIFKHKEGGVTKVVVVVDAYYGIREWTIGCIIPKPGFSSKMSLSSVSIVTLNDHDGTWCNRLLRQNYFIGLPDNFFVMQWTTLLFFSVVYVYFRTFRFHRRLFYMLYKVIVNYRYYWLFMYYDKDVISPVYRNSCFPDLTLIRDGTMELLRGSFLKQKRKTLKLETT